MICVELEPKRGRSGSPLFGDGDRSSSRVPPTTHLTTPKLFSRDPSRFRRLALWAQTEAHPFGSQT